MKALSYAAGLARALPCPMVALILLTGVAVGAQPSHAQEADASAQQQTTQDDASEQTNASVEDNASAQDNVSAQDDASARNDDSNATDATDPQGNVAAQEEADEPLDPQQTAGRFIPTEEISQDLGVSFPVDI